MYMPQGTGWTCPPPYSLLAKNNLLIHVNSMRKR